MNNYIKYRLKIYLSILISIIIILSISTSLLFKEDYFNNVDKICRVLVNNQLNSIVNNDEVIQDKYKYTIISLDGKVIKSTENININDTELKNVMVNGSEYIEDKDKIRYWTLLVKDKGIKGVVVFTIPKKDVLVIKEDNIYKLLLEIVIIFSTLGILLLIFKIYKLITKDILVPINSMHKSAIEILRGNYLERVNYDYYGEIGEFSHDFEKMRDSLLVAREKEEKLNKSEKELLACISHDLKTPIANISGYCEGIIDGVVKEEKDIKRYIGIVLKKSRVLNKLLDDILELSKAEINQMTINRKEVYSEEFFQELLEEISIDVASGGRKFKLEGEIPNILINIDRDKITQAINNIINNSIKYTSNEGVITVSLKRIQKGLEIICKDNGIGIAEDELQLVFNKFYRSDKHRNQNIPGSGLGLSIAKYIVEKHNGSIELFSGKGGGTTVVIRIR